VTHAGVNSTDINNALAIVEKVRRAHCAGAATPSARCHLSESGSAPAPFASPGILN
jgi:hypothetical protein